MNKSAIKKEELTIGRWGRAWQRFVQENYPDETAELKETALKNLLLRLTEKHTAYGNCSVNSTQRKILARLPLWKR